MLCICHSIPLEKVALIAKEKGYTIEQLQAMKIACSKCKLCVPYLEQMGIKAKTS